MTRPMRHLSAAMTLALGAALAGCAVTQPKPPEVDLPVMAAPTEAQAKLLERWWLAFDDPALTTLIDEALVHNYDVASAFARIELARANVLLSQSYLYPNANLVRRRVALAHRGVGSQPLPAGTPLISNNFSVGVELGYELDLWGKYRSGVARRAQRARRVALLPRDGAHRGRRRRREHVLPAARGRRRAQAASRTRSRRARTPCACRRDRLEGGIIGDYDLKQAEAERSDVVADIARARQAIGLLEGALATLTGRSPREVFAPVVARADVDRARSSTVPELPDGLAVGPDRAPPRHPPRRGAARRVRAAHPAGARRRTTRRSR